MEGILDNDLYKFTMQQAICEHFPRTIVRYSFTNRADTPFPEGFADRMKMEISSWVKHHLNRALKHWLANTCSFLSPVYLDFLAGYEYNPHEVSIAQEGGALAVLVEGPWYRTVLWEVPILALISELYFDMTGESRVMSLASYGNAQKRIANKAKKIKKNKLTVADFGTRRRFSFACHNDVIERLKDVLVGTSNVHLAHQYQIKPIGTHAHEWFMYHAVKYGYQAANYMALKNWAHTFKGNLGIALTDTFTSEIFFQSFDTMYSKLFDGIRQDSGSPEDFIGKAVAHYKQHGIDPTTKTIVFSDNLYVEKALSLKFLCDRAGIKCAFGIGTNLTNDVGVKPLNIVIKLLSVLGRGGQWLPAVKLSDDTGKHTGDPEEIRLCKEVLRCN